MDQKELLVTAELAQLEPLPEELEALGAGVSQMLDHFATMAAAPVDDLPPTTHVPALVGGLRPDVVAGDPAAVHIAVDPESLVSAAADSEDAYYTVPNVL